MGHKQKKRSLSESDSESKISDKKHKISKKNRDSKEYKLSKRLKKKHKKEKKYRKSKNEICQQPEEVSPTNNELADVPLELMTNSKAMVPLTKEEWEKRQNVTKRVFDEESGRYRLIKGDGEVIEEIVSRSRHQEINKIATKGDGTYFQTEILAKIKNSK